MTLDQVYDELYGEIDQIKNELKNTLAQIQYASNFTEGVSLGTLSVGAESSQVIAPHVALLPGAESGMMVLDLPVGTESAMLPVMIQDDPEATELVPDAIPTGETMKGYLNSNVMTDEDAITIPDTTISFTLRKFANGMKTIHFANGSIPADASTHVGVIPAKYRPINGTRLILVNRNDGGNFNTRIVQMDYNGNLAIGGAASNGVYGDAFYC